MKKYTGIWPVAPTIFDDKGALDLNGMKRTLDYMIDCQVDGICILANFSEQFLISDEERDILAKTCIEYINGRVPIIVTISHFATKITVERAQRAKDLGADIVMMMAPYHGALLKAAPQQIYEHFQYVGDVGIPIMVQDAPISGVDLSVDLLVRMARDIDMVKLFKIECPQAANKIRELIALGGDAIECPFDGEEAITLLADLDAGITGSMTSAMFPDLIKPIISNYHAGNIQQAIDGYQRVLPAINHENRQCGWRSTKAALKSGGIITSDYCRHPIMPLHPAIHHRLIELLKPLNPLILNWSQ